tara:strand:- start:48 stop:491 length:444 start_codon:yes stop_codon:yes gene_type:complete
MKISKKQLKKIILEEKAKLLSEGLVYTNEYAQDTFGGTEKIFANIAQEFGWTMESIDGEITDDVGSGEYRAVFRKGEDMMELSYYYVYAPYDRGETEMEYYLKTSVGEIDGEFRTEGWQEDLVKLFQSYDRAQSMDLQKFKSLVEMG